MPFDAVEMFLSMGRAVKDLFERFKKIEKLQFYMKNARKEISLNEKIKILLLEEKRPWTSDFIWQYHSHVYVY